MKKPNLELDSGERRIYDAFSQINVDTEKLKRRINSMERTTTKGRFRISVAFAAVLIFVTISITAFSATGGLEQFISRFNPAFGDIAIPPTQPAYAEDQGIRIEVIGAQQVGNVVLAYVTMQDITGENRLSRRYTRPDLEIRIDGQAISGASTSRPLHFDRASNTVYYEKIIVGDIGIPRADTLEIGATSILYFGPSAAATGQIQTFAEGEWLVQVSTSDADNQVLVWADVPAGDVHIEYMSLSPLGVQITGSHDVSMDIIMGGGGNPTVEIEVENRRRNIRPSGSGSGISEDWFDSFFFFDHPIDVEAVTGVIVNGVRLTPPYQT